MTSRLPAAMPRNPVDAKPRRVLVATDKFKGTLSASDAAQAICAGFARRSPGWSCTPFPVADGGEGSVEALVRAGIAAPVECVARGPLGDRVLARFAREGSTAYIEAAEACGLALVSPITPASALRASTVGVADLIRHALDRGCTRCVLFVGGTATTDGGIGMLAGLGAEIHDSFGADVPEGGRGLSRASRLSTEHIDPRLRHTEIIVAADVTNPLTGPAGAAEIYAPQKGADPGAVAELEHGLRNLVRLSTPSGEARTPGPGSGAGGGLAFGAVEHLQATIQSGAEWILDELNFDKALAEHAVVVTGEGSLDYQSLEGKATVAIARRAAAQKMPCIALAGRVTLPPKLLEENNLLDYYALTALAPSSEVAMANAEAWLASAAEQAARRWLTETDSVL